MHFYHFGQHCGPENVVVRANSVNGEDRQPWIQLSGDSDGMTNAIGACSHGESKLKWRARRLDCIRELSCQHFRDESAERCSRGDPPHTSRFWRPVMVANINARHTSSGTWPRAKSSAACNNNESVSASSRQVRNISFVHPPDL